MGRSGSSLGWRFWGSLALATVLGSPAAHAGVAWFGGKLKGEVFQPGPVDQPISVRFVTTRAEATPRRITATIEERVTGAGLAVGVLPLPPGVDADDVSVWIDGKAASEMGGTYLASEASSGLFATLAKGTQSSAPLAWTGRAVYLLPAVTLGPRTVVRIEVRAKVMETDGFFVATLPMPQAAFSARPVQRTRVTLRLSADKPLRAVFSPTHDLDVRREGPRVAVARLTADDLIESPDLQVFFVADDDALGLRVLTHRAEGEDAGYFALLGQPTGGGDAHAPPKDVVLTVDTSGSMRGEKMEQARAAVAYVLDHLNPGDRFNLVTFGTDVARLGPDVVPADPASLARARDFVDNIVAHGRTNISEALAASLGGPPGDRPRIVIFLTDGSPTAGDMVPDRIAESVPALNTSHARVFVMGVGHDVHTHLLDRLAADTGGTTTYVGPEEAIDVKLATLYDGLSYPVLADVSLDFGTLAASRVEPATVPSLFQGQEIMVFGRYTGEGAHTLTLKGSLDGAARAYTVTADFPAKARPENAFIASLWAGRRIGALLRKLRLRGEDEETVAEIVELSRTFGILTEYTRFLADEDLGGDEAQLRTSGLLREANAQTSGKWAVEQAGNEAHLMKKRVASNRDNVYTDRRGERQQAATLKTVGRRTFYRRDGKWVQTGSGAAPTKSRTVKRFSPEYFRMVEEHPDVASAQSLDGQMELTVDDEKVTVE